jgi:hypothetical protein
LQHVAPEALPELLKGIAAQGLTVLPLAREARANGYQSAAQPMGELWDYRCAIIHANKSSAWVDAWQAGNNDAIGALLGYPKCCREFFEQAWVKERWFDTTWPMARNLAKGEIAEVPAGVGILWRWHGVRTVSHLPCSFECQSSLEQSKTTLQIMAKRFPEEAEWLTEATSWPVEWTALHGIAEIRTPITRTSVATDATANKLTVRYLGEGYPAEGASGLTFPHRPSMPKPIKLLLSNSKDNGFSTHAAMQQAHAQLLAQLYPPYKTILDLGCGDGLLASKIPAARRIGVEQDQRVAKLAERRLDRVIVGDVTNKDLVNKILAEEQPDLVIAQRDRNPVETLRAPTILSYTYENTVEGKLVNRTPTTRR